MKKALAFVLALVTIFGVLSLTSCRINPDEDWAKIQEKGYFVVGCTEFDPMNYYEDAAKTKLVGFDTEYAQAVAAYLGVEVKFEMITWSIKYMELDGGKVDCLWNGFTSNSEDDGVPRADKVTFSTGYALNTQCIVMKSDSTFTDVDALAGKKCAVEGGSAGEAFANTVTDSDKIVTKDAQIDAFTELAGGKVDFIVVDALLATKTCGKGNFTNCEIKYKDEAQLEIYAIGCRKGSSFAAKIEEATKALVKDGTLQRLADKYGVPLTDEVLALGNQ